MTFAKLPPDILRAHKGVSFTGISAIFFCHDADGRIFLAQRSKNARDEHGRWTPGAGGHKHGETLENTVVRELKEEFSTEPKAIEFMGYFDVFRELPDGTPTGWLAMTFAVHVDPETVKIGEPDMFDEYGWFTLDALPQPLHSQFDLFLELHGETLRQILAKTKAGRS